LALIQSLAGLGEFALTGAGVQLTWGERRAFGFDHGQLPFAAKLAEGLRMPYKFVGYRGTERLVDDLFAGAGPHVALIGVVDVRPPGVPADFCLFGWVVAGGYL
jgi:hypothetical protein